MTRKAVDVYHNVGIYGGAFDPPHRAHVSLAETALAHLKLDILHIVPTGDAAHKRRHLTAAVHRMTMTQLAFAGVDKTIIDDREVQRGGASYTIDTLLELRKLYPHAKLHLIIGQDQLMAFRTWLRFEEILQIATLAVAARGKSEHNHQLEATSPIQHSVIPFTPNHLSSSDVRQMIRLKEQDAAFTTTIKPSVLHYIHEHQLYLNNP